MAHHFPELDDAARRVLSPTGDQEETGVLRVGDAVVDQGTRAWVAWATGREHHPVNPREILRALTDVRRQTARAHATGAPTESTLRASRVVLRGLRLDSRLTWLDGEPSREEVRCLALCALGVRHAGLGRNRGRGHVRLSLDGDGDSTRRRASEGAP